MARIPSIVRSESAETYVVKQAVTIDGVVYQVGDHVDGDVARGWGTFTALIGSHYLLLREDAAAYVVHHRMLVGTEYLEVGDVVDGDVARSWPTFDILLNSLAWLTPARARQAGASSDGFEPKKETERWLPLADAARQLGVSVDTARRRVRKGELVGEQRQVAQGHVWWIRVNGNVAPE